MYLFPVGFKQLLRVQPPTATLAMVEGGGGRKYGIQMLLDQVLMGRKHITLLFCVKTDMLLMCIFSGENSHHRPP